MFRYLVSSHIQSISYVSYVEWMPLVNICGGDIYLTINALNDKLFLFTLFLCGNGNFARKAVNKYWVSQIKYYMRCRTFCAEVHFLFVYLIEL